MINSAVRLVIDAVLRRDRSSSESSVRTRITSATVTIASFSVVVKSVALGSTLLIASLFGTGDDIEAYFIAFLIPSFIFHVISGSFSSAMIPTYVQVKGATRASTRIRSFLSDHVSGCRVIGLSGGYFLRLRFPLSYDSWVPDLLPPRRL